MHPTGHALQVVSVLPIDRAALTGAAAVEQMADDLRVFAANNGSVTERDLRLAGWTRTQLEIHGEKAAQKARAVSVRDLH